MVLEYSIDSHSCRQNWVSLTKKYIWGIRFFHNSHGYKLRSKYYILNNTKSSILYPYIKQCCMSHRVRQDFLLCEVEFRISVLVFAEFDILVYTIINESEWKMNLISHLFYVIPWVTGFRTGYFLFLFSPPPPFYLLAEKKYFWNVK